MPDRGFLRSVLLPAEGWLAVVFATGVSLSSVWSVEAAGWVEHLHILSSIAVLAVLAGFVLSKVRLPGLALHVLGLSGGGALILYATAATLPSYSLRVNLMELWHRFQGWLTVTLHGDISTDNLLFLLLMCAIVWLMGYFGAWSIFRNRGPWWLILTSGCVLIVNLSYSRSLDWFALLYLVSSMGLIVRLNVAVQEDAWLRSGVQYPADLIWRLIWTSFIAGSVAIAAAWIGPDASLNSRLAQAWAEASGPWRSAESQFSRFFGGVRSKDAPTVSSFGKTLALRGSSPLSGTPVLAVGEREAQYLRAVVYDRYTGQGWLAPESTTQQLQPNEPRLTSGDFSLRRELAVSIEVLQPRGTTVVSPAQPARVGLPLEADFAVGGAAGPVDPTMLRSSMMLRRGLQYVAAASISRAGVKELREDGTDYPSWVRQRYLELPQSVPRRVLTLARRLTNDVTNAYDKAVAIQTYLRSYPYSESVPGPPPGRDTVDFFLFDVKVGYCDYYASAMVVALRSLGVPARVVSGYAPGEYDPVRQVALVRDADAHSWPEVFFPRYGWIPFEPTASRPALVRPAEASPAQPSQAPPPIVEPNTDALNERPPDHGQSDRAPEPDAGGGSTKRPGLMYQLLALLSAAATAYLIIRLTARRVFGGHSLAESTYGRMSILAGWLGVRAEPHQTPYEYGRRLGELVPKARPDVELIVERFVRERFGRKSPLTGDASSLNQAWRRLRAKLLGSLWRRARVIRPDEREEKQR